MIRVRHWNWDAQQYDTVEYPDEIIQPFIDWIMTSHSWETDPRRMKDRVLDLQRQFADYRQGRQTHTEAVTVDPAAASLADRRKANLAKARAAKAAKKLGVKDAVTV